MIAPEAARVMSLRDGTRKMSKSDASDQSRINMTDTDDAISDKIRRARTDPEPLPGEPDGLRDRPEARNLVEIMAAATGGTVATVLAAHRGQGFSTFKAALADALIAIVGPIRRRTEALLADTAELDQVLRDGAARASAIADPIVAEAERLVGCLGPIG